MVIGVKRLLIEIKILFYYSNVQLTSSSLSRRLILNHLQPNDDNKINLIIIHFTVFDKIYISKSYLKYCFITF